MALSFLKSNDAFTHTSQRKSNLKGPVPYILYFFPEVLRNINNFVEKEATSVMLLKDIILQEYACVCTSHHPTYSSH